MGFKPPKITDQMTRSGAFSRGVEATGKAIKNALDKRGTTSMLKAVKGSQGSAFFGKRREYKLMKNIINKDFKKTAARAAAASAIAKNYSDAKVQAAKMNYQAQKDALDRYAQIIAQQAQPAEGTGEPSAGENGGQSNPSSIEPTGNL